MEPNGAEVDAAHDRSRGSGATLRPTAAKIRWRSKLESIVSPVGVILVSMILFGLFVALQGVDPMAVFASIKKASFGTWFSFQNTLVRAAPLMLCALGTAIPLRLGLVVIGNEGALVIGGLCATAAGLHRRGCLGFHLAHCHGGDRDARRRPVDHGRRRAQALSRRE